MLKLGVFRKTFPYRGRARVTEDSPAALHPGTGQRRGQSLVEFALVLPVLLLTLGSMVDLALAFYSYGSIGNAARQGARYGSIWTNVNDDTGIRNYVVSAAGPSIGLVNDASHIVVSAVRSVSDSTIVPAGSRTSGNLLTVEAHYDYVAISPLLSGIIPSGVISLVVSSTALVE